MSGRIRPFDPPVFVLGSLKKNGPDPPAPRWLIGWGNSSRGKPIEGPRLKEADLENWFFLENEVFRAKKGFKKTGLICSFPHCSPALLFVKASKKAI